ncbi:hypothetical protein ACFWQG_00065, partial [Rhodococcus sp. NPDC058532]
MSAAALALLVAAVVVVLAVLLLRRRTRRTLTTPEERAVHATLHTASLAARPLGGGRVDTTTPQGSAATMQTPPPRSPHAPPTPRGAT